MGMHEDILRLIQVNGPMGVNAIQRHLDIPLSTIQKYLDKQQNYFKKTERRQWDLPENREMSDFNEMKGNVATIVESQLIGVNATFELLNQQIKTIINLSANLKPVIGPSVAEKVQSIEIDPSITELLNMVQVIEGVIKKYKEKIPDEYLDLLLNTDLTRLAASRGSLYLQENLGGALSQIVLEDGDILPEGVVKMLETYQKKVKNEV